MMTMTYTEIKHMVDDACGNTVDEYTKENIVQGFHNTSMMWGLTNQQCSDLIRVARAAYWAGQRNAEG